MDLVKNIAVQSYDAKYTDTFISLGQVQMANLDPEKASWLNIGAKTATGPNLGTLAENQKKIVTVFSRDTFQNLIYGK